MYCISSKGWHSFLKNIFVMPDTIVLLVLSVENNNNFKLFLYLSVLCYFAYWNPRGIVGLHFLDEQLRKTVSICRLWKFGMGKCRFIHGQRMDKICFARDIKEQRTLGCAAAPRKLYTPVCTSQQPVDVLLLGCCNPCCPSDSSKSQ